MAKITQQMVLDVPTWANDNFKQVMARKVRKQARKQKRVQKIKNTLWTIWLAIMVCILIIMTMMWLKNGYVIKW